MESTSLISPLKFGSLFGLLASFIPVVAAVIGLMLLGYLFYGAYLWLSSSGEPDRLNQAKNTIVNAVIGFVLFAVMLGLFFFISKVMGVDWTDIFTRANPAG